MPMQTAASRESETAFSMMASRAETVESQKEFDDA